MRRCPSLPCCADHCAGRGVTMPLPVYCAAHCAGHEGRDDAPPCPAAQRTVLAMTRVGLPSHDQEAIFRTVAAILHLGNIAFVPTEGGEACAVGAGAGDYHAARAGGCCTIYLEAQCCLMWRLQLLLQLVVSCGQWRACASRVRPPC